MSREVHDSDFRFAGTGRANFTGGGATVTVPKDAAVDVFDLNSDGVDVAYFTDGDRLILTKKEDVEL